MDISVKYLLFFSLLSLAAVWDIRKRIIPDWIPAMMIALSFMPPGRFEGAGLLAALPFFLAGVMIGGIGGGDIKIAGASGTILGFTYAMSGIIIGLWLLILYHVFRKIVSNRKEEQAYPLVPFLWAGMLVSFFIGGKFT